MTDPLRLYSDTLATAAMPASVRFSDGTVNPLPLDRYLAPADETDARILAGVCGPVLDVGCGPGRHLHALAQTGVFALGVDLSPVAVRIAKAGGGQAIVGSIFDEIPGPGTWGTALLLDGNIGIGGAPSRLLGRLRALLAANGEVVVELSAPDSATGTLHARIETPQTESSWFRWAQVSSSDVDAVAELSGFQVLERWTDDGRWFARLR